MRFMVCVEITKNPDGHSRSELLVKLGRALEHGTAQEALSEALSCEVCLKASADPIAGFFNAIESTGGVARQRQGWYIPVVDEDWIDLGEAYVEACAAFGREPMVVEKTDPDDHDDEEDSDRPQSRSRHADPGGNF
jgi:hypothetical protein